MQLGRIFLCSATKSKKLNALKVPDARWMYVMIHVHADVQGNYTADPVDLKVELFARLWATTDNIAEALDELEAVGLIKRYGDRKEYLHVVGYERTPGLIKDRHSPKWPAFDKTHAAPVKPAPATAGPQRAEIKPKSEAAGFIDWFKIKHQEIHKKPLHTTDRDEEKVHAVFNTYKSWDVLRKMALKFLKYNEFAAKEASYSIGVYASQINFLYDCIRVAVKHNEVDDDKSAQLALEKDFKKARGVGTDNVEETVISKLLKLHEENTGECIEMSFEMIKQVKHKESTHGLKTVEKVARYYYKHGGDSLTGLLKNFDKHFEKAQEMA